MSENKQQPIIEIRMQINNIELLVKYQNSIDKEHLKATISDFLKLTSDLKCISAKSPVHEIPSFEKPEKIIFYDFASKQIKVDPKFRISKIADLHKKEILAIIMYSYPEGLTLEQLLEIAKKVSPSKFGRLNTSTISSHLTGKRNLCDYIEYQLKEGKRLYHLNQLGRKYVEEKIIPQIVLSEEK